MKDTDLLNGFQTQTNLLHLQSHVNKYKLWGGTRRLPCLVSFCIQSSKLLGQSPGDCVKQIFDEYSDEEVSDVDKTCVTCC